MIFQPRHLYLLSVLIFVGAALFAMMRTFVSREALPERVLPPQKVELPTSFAPQTEAFRNDPFIRLAQSSVKLELPDLRSVVVYCGTSERPDSNQQKAFIHFAIRGTNLPVTIFQGEKLFLQHDPRQNRFSFSDNNRPTSLWLRVEKAGNEVEVEVGMRDEDNNLVVQPAVVQRFILPETPLPAMQKIIHWNVVDGTALNTFLHRYNAVWCGQDRFLQEYGGEEFAFLGNKERIEFSSQEALYSCYVGIGESLAFINDRWQEVDDSGASRGKPLLHVKKIEAQSILFDLWDEEGKNKISVLLPKTNTPPVAESTLKMNVVGAKARKKWIVELDGKREIVGEDDWLIFYDNRWQRLSRIEDVEAYVEGELKGNLLVFEGVQKVEGKQALVGKLFNEMRNEYSTVAIPLARSQEVQKMAAPLPQEIDEEPLGNNEMYPPGNDDDFL